MRDLFDQNVSHGTRQSYAVVSGYYVRRIYIYIFFIQRALSISTRARIRERKQRSLKRERYYLLAGGYESAERGWRCVKLIARYICQSRDV